LARYSNSTTNGVLTTLFNFILRDGETACPKMAFGPDGSLYGTTARWFHRQRSERHRLGDNLSINDKWPLHVPLFNSRAPNGSNPDASLTLGPDGNLYGSNANGGPGGGGTIFRIVSHTPLLTGITKGVNGGMVVVGSGLPGNP